MNDPDTTPDASPPPTPEVSPAPAPPPPAAPTPSPSGNPFATVTGRQWSAFIHFGQFAGYLVPGLGFAVPIVIWQVYKDQFPEIDPHGKMVTNWMISLLIYSVVAGAIAFITCGIGVVLFIPLAVLSIIFPILGGIKANEGIVWNYPLTISFIK